VSPPSVPPLPAGERESLAARLFPYAVFAALVAISWNRWVEPYVDTGRELMVPWRIAGGEVLYRDVQFPHGPLAPFLGAAIDWLAGRSLAARTVFAALIGIAHLEALGNLARRMLPAWRAALATAIAVGAAAFLRPGGWLFPFSFDTAIAVAALLWALVFSLGGRRSGDAAAAVCLFLALVARLEMGLAGIAVLGLATIREPRRLGRLAAAPLAAAAIAYGLVSAGIPFRLLVADGWLRLIDPPEAFRNVYRAYAGLDRVPLRLAELLLSCLVLVVFGSLLAAGSLLAQRLRPRHRSAAALAAALPVAILAAAAAVRLRPPERIAESLSLFPPLLRPIPVLLALGAALRLAARLRGREPGRLLARVPDAVLWMAALFGARLLLAAGYVGPYDAFFLPLPILLAAAGLFALADDLSAALGEALPRMTAASLAIFLIFRMAAAADLYRRPGWSPVATPAGTVVLPEPEAETTRRTLLDLQRRFPSGATLVGFPETGFFNYVLGWRNPGRIEQFFPGTLDASGERQAAAALEARPPDAILYANVLAVGEGARVFGEDYLRRLDAAVRSRSRTVAVHGPGARPGARIGDPGFFVEIRVPSTDTRP
jgi:hypothetical protein